MKKILSLLTFLICSLSFGQSLETDKNSDLYKNAPAWAKLMYTENPNVNEVDKLYESYFNNNRYQKSYHTQYYKRWRKSINPYLNNDGYFDPPKSEKISQVIEKSKNAQNNRSAQAGTWTSLGPFRDFNEGGTIQSGGQANVFTIGRCEAFPNIMYCGTEPGEVYKSTDGANTWSCVSNTLVTTYFPQGSQSFSGISGLAVHPTNPDIVYIASGKQVYKTIDSGANWISILNNIGSFANYFSELHINSLNPEIIIATSRDGLQISTNGGTNWNQVLTNECYDIKANTANPTILYTVRKNNTTNTHEFLTSTDSGITWTPQTTGWYTSTNASRTVLGARIAVTTADSNRIYAYLIGDSKSGDNGFIGVYRSNDGGVSWTNTMGYNGAPYDATTHPNLASSRPITESASFQQGFYNCAIMASNTNPDEILVGGIGMWRSNNGGQSFTCIHNYTCGNYSPMHVDMQDFRAMGNDHWATTDGGIYKSNNMFASQPEFKMNGVRAVDFWGFGSGWNRDILVGGTFHNGVDAYAEEFPNGDFLNLIGGEPASGYVSPGSQSRVYSTGLGSAFIPQTITGDIISAPYEASLNETAWFAESSELEFHPSCYNIMYKGYQNKLFKSTDGGATFSVVYTESDINSKILGIEISRTNTNTMYIVIRPIFGNSYLKKTTDDWATSSTIVIPNLGILNSILSIISIDPENDQIIWLAFPRASDGDKVFKSINGGINWTNQTSSELDAQNIRALTTIGGTNGGVYIATNITCYYKNDSMSNWAIDNTGLPTTISTRNLKPFYRDGKIRIASSGKGIWESPLFESPTRPVAKIMVDKLVSDFTCNNVFSFDDYSMLNHAGATWAWTFQDANIATSSLRNPQVTFNSLGNHTVTLTVTNANGISSTDTLTVSCTNLITATTLNQNFEVQLLPQDWFQEGTGTYSWVYLQQIGAFGQSSKCMSVNNFDINQQGQTADMIAPTVNMLNISTSNAVLTFDVAYALYGEGNQDALQVLVSSDCGENSTLVYNKVGANLATAPSTQQPFFPTATQWRTETVDLSSFIGNPNVSIKLRNINQFGQNLFVDNINFGGQQLSTAEFNSDKPIVYPNPLTNSGFINVKSNETGAIKFNLFSIDGKLIDTVFTKFNTPIPIEEYNLSQGTYFYKIISNDKIMTGKLLITNGR